MKTVRRKIIVTVCLALACFFALAACNSNAPPPPKTKADTQRPVIDLAGVQATVGIRTGTALNVSASDNVTAADMLAWEMAVEKDGLDVTAKTYEAATRVFTPAAVGVYDFTLKVTDEAGNYIIRTFQINAEIDIWRKTDYTFSTAAGTPTTTEELDYVTIGTNGIEFAKEYAPFAYTYTQHPMRKFDLVETDGGAPAELQGSFFIEFDYNGIDSYQNSDNSRIALEFTRKGTATTDEIFIENNYSVLEYFTNIAGVGKSGTSIYVSQDAGSAKYDRIKIGRFVNESENACTYVFYHNNIASAYQKVAGNFSDEVTIKLYSYKSKGKVANLRLGQFDDTAAPALAANEDFPVSAQNDDRIDLNKLFIEDDIVPAKYVEVLYDVRDGDGEAVSVDFNRTFRAGKAGNFSVKIKAKDLSGNESGEITKTVSVSDTRAPRISFAGQVSAAIVGADTVFTPVVADGFAGALTVSHTVKKNGAATMDATVTESGGAYTFNAAAAGTYTLELTATDGAGNTGTGSHEIAAIAADTEAPEITIDDPGQLMTQMSNMMYFDVSDNASAPVDITVASRMVKGGTSSGGAVSGGTSLAASGTPGVSANWYNPTTRVFSTYNRGANSTGDYWLEVTATDEAANSSTASLKVNVKQTGDVYDTVEYVGWGWESYHNHDRYPGIVLGKDSVTIPSRSANSGDQLNFVPYIRKYFAPADTMDGDFDFELDYEDITPAIAGECNVRIMLYYAQDAENTMGRQTDTVAFGAYQTQSWLEININQSGSWQNGPQKIALSGKHHFKAERRIFNGNAYYRYFVDGVCLNPDGQNVGTAYKQYLVGLNFFGHKAGGKFSAIRFTQK
ncbi:MAG: hypothetical protein LBL66_07805 [Clostridiales bacterium]|jgi:hypothetical protein|nr:hypothetical protein [Clostridiales bacterium]